MSKSEDRSAGNVPAGVAAAAARPAWRAALRSLVVLVCLGCGGREIEISESPQTPIILISIDTLRSDRLPAYGYKEIATPHFDTFRADSILFERAYSHSPLTAPSHATMLTGLLPGDNGIRDNAGFRMKKEIVPLAEILRSNGYRTGAAVSAYVLCDDDFARGFDFYEQSIERRDVDQGLGREQRPGAETIALAKRWIESQSSDRLFFMLHLYEPHTPYEAPEPYRSATKNRYDAEVAYADALTGDFLQFLKDRGIYDKAMIILLSDHGEGLSEHGEAEHGLFLYREAIQVPLIVKLPKNERKGSTVSAPAQLADIFPTVIEAAGAKSEKRVENARSLLALNDEPRRVYSESYYGRIHFGWSDLHSLIDGEHHYIHAPEPELYALSSDFQERNNVLTQNRRLYAAWRKEIEPSIKPLQEREAISPEEAAKLAALGYLGSSNMATDATLEDPKSQIETFNQVKDAYALFHDGKLNEALAKFEEILKAHPRMSDVWTLKMTILSRLGQPLLAIDAGKRALQLSPSSSAIALTIATLSLQANQVDQAQKHAELALEREPASAHSVLARVALAKGDLNGAEEHAKKSLAVKENEPLPWMTLAAVHLERRDPAGALQMLDRATAVIRETKRPDVSMLNFMRGDALARLGRNAEAEAAFKEEIRFVPHDPRAYTRLMLLYFSLGRYDEATALVRQLIEKSPRPESYLAVVETLRVVGDNEGAAYWARAGSKRFPKHALLRKVAEQRL